MQPAAPFWETTPLDRMTTEQWESLCDGCGRCCLHKLRDEDTEELAFTNVSCRLLDTHSCRCTRYETRRRWVPDCVSLTPETLAGIDWLPPTCAYRRVAEGRGLAAWHPLVSGTSETVHSAGISVRDRATNERRAGALEDHVVEWPGQEPRAPRRKFIPRPAPPGAGP